MNKTRNSSGDEVASHVNFLYNDIVGLIVHALKIQ